MNAFLQMAFYLVVLLALARPLGVFMANVYEGKRTFLTPALGWLEGLIYRAGGVGPDEDMDWKRYLRGVTNPFGVGELLARVPVALRHAARSPSGERKLALGRLGIDLGRRQVTRDSKEVHLTPNEYRLLACLAQHLGMVVTHRQLLREVWGPSHVEHTHYLRIFMKQLRDKLEDDPIRPRHLLTETGIGYRLVTGDS